MGPLAVLLYRRIVHLKILSDLNVVGEPLNFLQPVLEYYGAYYQNPLHADKIKKLLDVIPNLSQIKKGLKFRMRKENLIYKIVLDVIGQYLKETYSYKVRYR